VRLCGTLTKQLAWGGPRAGAHQAAGQKDKAANNVRWLAGYLQRKDLLKTTLLRLRPVISPCLSITITKRFCRPGTGLDGLSSRASSRIRMTVAFD